ncbi:MAG TPA: rod shape-determining protein RodA [Verrucomicrobiae bacterium]|nr:rod shape-determining protein RodA [Verrucomicrobiae bacterium]
MRIVSSFRYFDIILFGSSILLLLLGLLMIYSTTLESSSNLFLRQTLVAIAGIVGMFSLAFFDYRNLKKMTGLIYLAIVGLLLVVYFFGENIRGSVRWIDLGFFNLQPAELAKLGTVIIMAKFLDQAGERLKSYRYILLSAVYVAIPFVLILIEPDLGSSLIVFFTWFAMLFFSKIQKKQLVTVIAVGLVIAILSWFFVLHDYQKQRVFTFIDPTADPQGQGYNVLQSIIAVGSGGILGRGVGRGLQSQLKFLPERQTDFIFASTAEELGLLGSAVILVLFFLVLQRILRACRTARDNFGMYLALGIFFMMFFQILINIGMNIGIMPVTGIPLPLLSYGGSSLLTTLLSLGIIQSIVARQKALRFDG